MEWVRTSVSNIMRDMRRDAFVRVCVCVCEKERERERVRVAAVNP